MNYYNEIKEKLIENEIYEKVKDYSKERNRVITYYEIGKLLSEAGKHYGENIIGEYSKKLVVEVGKKYNRRTLFRMKQFYNTFKDEKVSPLVTQLTWSHYIILLSLKNYNSICYYIRQVYERNLSKRQLQAIIKNKEYERLPEKTKEKQKTKKESNIVDFIKNPILIKNKCNYEDISEKVLQKLIMEDKKNHWTKTKIEEAKKKINKEIYKRHRQASIHLKLDDLAIVINDSITIAKGLVFVQEDLNRNILKVQKISLKVLFSNNLEE